MEEIMRVTKNIFGKIKTVEISLQEIEAMTEHPNEILSYSLINWLREAINLRIIVPNKKND
jgi:hypothetical protein